MFPDFETRGRYHIPIQNDTSPEINWVQTRRITVQRQVLDTGASTYIGLRFPFEPSDILSGGLTIEAASQAMRGQLMHWLELAIADRGKTETFHDPDLVIKRIGKYFTQR